MENLTAALSAVTPKAEVRRILPVIIAAATVMLPGCPDFSKGGFTPPDGGDGDDDSADMAADDAAGEGDPGPEAEVLPDLPADQTGDDASDAAADDGAPGDPMQDDPVQDDPVVPPSEDCDNGLDDDGDGLTDCADGDCDTHDACSEICNPLSTISCGDTVHASNDAPGSTDRIHDAGCCSGYDFSGPEVAYRFVLGELQRITLRLQELSEDLDMFLLDDRRDECNVESCIDESSRSGSSSETIYETLEAGTYYVLINGWEDAVSDFTLRLTCTDPEICDNGVDDDGDGDTDCDDTDCRGTAWCPVETDCDNAVDDDGDTLTDCDDPDCDDSTVCMGETVCDDGVDNDGDTLVDCDDPDCADSPSCPP